MTIEKTLATPGQRLRRARVLAGISTRKEFEKKYNISANTLQGWEQGKNPLSEKGARRVVEAFKQEGLVCSVDWLLKGSGMPPRPYEMLHAGVREQARTDENVTSLNLKEEERIYQESQLFKSLNQNAIVLSITDDAMEPYFSVGDYIGGVQIFEDQISDYIGTICILELENNVIVPRYLHKGSHEGTYTASCTNPGASKGPFNLYNIKVISAAPIVWHRKKIAALV